MPQVCADPYTSHKGNVVGSHLPPKGQPDYAPPHMVRALYPPIEKKLTLEEIQAETTEGNWGERCRRPDYGASLRNPEQAYLEAMAILEAVEKALLGEPKRFGSLPSKQIKAMGKWTRDWIKVSFMVWMREVSPEKVFPCWQGGAAPAVAFIVPSRAGVRGPFFPEETVAHMPLTYFMDRNLLLSLLSRLPPLILNYAQGSAPEDRRYPLVTIGMPTITEEFIRMGRRSVPLVREMITATARWCSWAGIKIMALGGPLPSLTHYGEAIPDHLGVITTTGHGGTCALVEMMVKDLLSRRGDLQDRYVALVGSGSIGSAIAGHLLYRLPRVRLVIYDIDRRKLDGVYDNLRQNYRDRVSKSQGLGNLATRARIMISTATTPLTEELFQDGQEGTVIIDDSQPPSVGPDLARQLARKGISVIWVVGKLPPGYSTCPMLTWEVESNGSRYKIPWLYGSPPGLGEFTGGLVDNTTLWGCGLEGLVLGLLLHQGGEANVRKLAIRGPVTPEKVETVAALFERFGISIPATYQAFGHTVDIQS